ATRGALKRRPAHLGQGRSAASPKWRSVSRRTPGSKSRKARGARQRLARSVYAGKRASKSAARVVRPAALAAASASAFIFGRTIPKGQADLQALQDTQSRMVSPIDSEASASSPSCPERASRTLLARPRGLSRSSRVTANEGQAKRGSIVLQSASPLQRRT